MRDTMVLPEGRHDAYITDHGYRTSTGGTLQLWVDFKAEKGEIKGWFALTEKSAEYTVQKIRAMGYQGDDLDVLNDGQTMRGNWCTITVEDEVYNGQTRAKVTSVDPFGAPPRVARLDPSKLQAANAKRFNALLKREAKVAPAKPKAAPAAGPAGDDPPPIEDPYPGDVPI